jgi:acyl carrier protein
MEKLRIIMKSIEDRVKELVIEQMSPKKGEVKVTDSFVEDLGADSLDKIELIMNLEEEFNTEIPDSEAKKITTVQMAIDHINSI